MTITMTMIMPTMHTSCSRAAPLNKQQRRARSTNTGRCQRRLAATLGDDDVVEDDKTLDVMRKVCMSISKIVSVQNTQPQPPRA